MFSLTQKMTFQLYMKPTDMRKGFEGLGGLVRSQMGSNPTDGSVYIFINRRQTLMKLLVWESSGFLLYYKRLEQGTFEWPVTEDTTGKKTITWETLVLMFQGIKLNKIKRKKRYKMP